MKLATIDRPIERISTKPERQFTIKATGKAFRILSSGLYKEKILAVVRELSCNAYDAHVAAGCKDRPFDIHLPNNFEPFFSVRDYGPALSPEQITSVFTTYFESTKTDDNNQIGGLGLGCKSPLSYVDSFTVISRYQGVKRTYTVFFDENDTPSMAEMADEVSDEETGLEVQLPVRPASFYEFKDRAEKVFRYFPVKPNVIGSGEYRHQTPEVVLSGPNYNLVEGDQNARAVMGTVAYPIDSGSISTSSVGYDLLRESIDIHFDVGSLDIQAGREELSYDERTKEAISKRIDEILTDMTVRIIRAVSRCKTEYEARLYYANVLNKFPVTKRLFNNSQVPYRGRMISTAFFDLDMKKDFPNSFLLQFDFVGLTRSKITTSCAANQLRDADRTRIEAHDTLRFIIDDLNGKETASRVRQFDKDNPRVRAYIVRAPQDELDKLKKLMAGVPFIPISTLDKSPVIPKTPTSVLKLDDYSRKHGASFKRHNWRRTTVEPTQGGVYVMTLGGAVQDLSGNKVSDFSGFYQRALNLKLFLPNEDELYSIPKSLMKNFTADDGWVNFFALVREQFEAKMIAENWAEHIAKAREIRRFSNMHNSPSSERSLVRGIATKLAEDHPMRAFIAAWDECTLALNMDSQISMSQTLGVAIPEVKTHNLTSLWDKAVGKKYPMMEYALSTNKWGRSEHDIAVKTAQYIVMLDRNCISETA